MIKAVWFDIDNTVYNFDKTHSIAMGKLEEYCMSEFHLEREEVQEAQRQGRKLAEQRTGLDCAASHNRLIRFQCMLEILHQKDLSLALKMYHIYWDTILSFMQREKGLKELILALRAKNIFIGIGTDMTAYIQYKKLEKLELLDFIDFMVSSEEAGAEKPSERFFRLCIDKCGCLPKECIFIGDNLKKDVIGSIQAGMHGVWYQPGQQQEQTEYPMIDSYENCIKGDKIFFGENIKL